jgi:hypothetical protein
MRFNQAIVGLAIGLFMPLLGFIIVYFIMGAGMGLSAFFARISSSGDMAGKVITLSVLANLIPFLIFNRRRWDLGVKGIVIATILYAVLFVYVKYIA